MLTSLVVLAVLALSACGGGSPAGDRKIVIWDIASGSSATTKAYIEKYAAAQGIAIDYQALPGDQLAQQLPIALRTGKGPDVFSPNNLVSLADAGYLQPLQDKVSAVTTKNLEAAWASPSQFVYHGDLVAIPTNLQTITLVVNKDLFRKAGLDPEAPPKTMSEMRADARTITQKVPGAAGFGLPLKFVGVAEWMIEPMVVNGSRNLTQNGLYNVDTHTYQFERYQPVLQTLRDMQADGSLYPGASSLDVDPLRAAFAAGKVAMYVDQSSGEASLDTVYKTSVDWSPAPTPVPDGETLQQQIVHIGGAFAMNKHASDKSTSMKVLEALVSPELAAEKAQAGQAVPAQSTVDLSKVDLKASPHLAALAYSPGGTQRFASTYPTGDLNVKGDTVKSGIRKLASPGSDLAAGLAALNASYNKALKAAVSSGKVTLSDYGYPSS